jgi:porphobilinogen synthase
MVRETSLSVNDLIYPMFVVHGKNIKKEISSLPGNYHLSVDRLVDDVKEVHALGIPAVLFFGLPEKKDEMASEAYSPDGIVPKAIRAVKEDVPEILVIGDVCLCEYTDHGHCGIINNGCVDNDASLELVSKMTLTFAQTGADMVAPSCMMDGQISTMRATLDENGYQDTCIMSYSSKFASKLYDPFFKHGTQSVVAFGDKKSYQMDIANSEEAMREIALDIEEGADIVMVKPGMYYLDIVYRAKQEFGMPLAVYNVSGEYTMIKSAAEMGRIDEQAVMLEVLTSLKRAGADLILTYFAKDVARELNNGNRY